MRVVVMHVLRGGYSAACVSRHLAHAVPCTSSCARACAPSWRALGAGVRERSSVLDAWEAHLYVGPKQAEARKGVSAEGADGAFWEMR